MNLRSLLTFTANQTNSEIETRLFNSKYTDKANKMQRDENIYLFQRYAKMNQCNGI